MEKLVDKTVKLNLVGIDGNAFSLMGAFSRVARQEGWTPEEIKLVTDSCMSGDYNHLLATLANHCEPIDEDDDEEFDFDDDEDEDDELEY